MLQSQFLPNRFDLRRGAFVNIKRAHHWSAPNTVLKGVLWSSSSVNSSNSATLQYKHHGYTRSRSSWGDLEQQNG
jgi:hypothetical protein